MIEKIIPWRLLYIRQFVMYKHRLPRLFNPKDYSDFVFRDNFFEKHNKRAYLADKYAVREYVKAKGLEQILTKLYGVWEDANDIDFSQLPKEFALKCNHSCGMNIICYDKDKLDKQKTIQQLNEWLKTEHPIYFERHYNHIKPLIICEEVIPSDEDGFFPMDYKIHCANGKPVFIQCCLERTEESGGNRVIYSPDWEKLPYTSGKFNLGEVDLARPKYLQEMLRYAEILSEGLEYARIDLYQTNKGIVFGEITLTPMGGWLLSFTQEALDIMGENIRKNKQGKHL